MFAEIVKIRIKLHMMPISRRITFRSCEKSYRKREFLLLRWISRLLSLLEVLCLGRCLRCLESLIIIVWNQLNIWKHALKLLQTRNKWPKPLRQRLPFQLLEVTILFSWSNAEVTARKKAHPWTINTTKRRSQEGKNTTTNEELLIVNEITHCRLQIPCEVFTILLSWWRTSATWCW